MSIGNQRAQIANTSPLRIHHLMIWMAVMAVLISGCMFFDRIMRNGPPIENKITTASLTVFAVVISGAWTFTGVGIARRERGYRFPASPGEWLMWLIATISLVYVAAFSGFFIAFALRLLFLYYVVVGLLLFFTWVRWVKQGYRSFGETRAWKVAIGFVGVMPVASLLFQSEWPFAFIALSLVVAAVTDVLRQITRGWMHWLGVSLMLLFSCAYFTLVAGLK